MTDTDDGRSATKYAYSCPDCGIVEEVVDSLDTAFERFGACRADDHRPEFERRTAE